MDFKMNAAGTRYLIAAVVMGATGQVLAGNDLLYSNGFEDDWSTSPRNVVVDTQAIALRGRLYAPPADVRNGAAVVAMHGCRGMWSNGQPDTVAQGAIEKWGRQLAIEGFFALAVDSYTDRTPEGTPPADFQVQCAGTPLAGAVDPYTTRVEDLDGAVAWMRYRLGALLTGPIGALGWSQGAQTVLVRAAETSRDLDVSLYGGGGGAIEPLAAAVAFYPGCGSLLGFGSLEASFWRPHGPMRINHAENDHLMPDCVTRVDRAIEAYGAEWMEFVVYPEADHSFDGSLSLWPDGLCTEGEYGDECAARAADIESMQFFLRHVE